MPEAERAIQTTWRQAMEEAVACLWVQVKAEWLREYEDNVKSLNIKPLVSQSDSQEGDGNVSV